MPENTPPPHGLTETRLARLAKSYRAAQEAAETARAALSGAIHEADTAGWPLRRIARAADLAPATTHRLLVAEAARHQLVHIDREADQ